jgi:hypothetical protein
LNFLQNSPDKDLMDSYFAYYSILFLVSAIEVNQLGRLDI